MRRLFVAAGAMALSVGLALLPVGSASWGGLTPQPQDTPGFGWGSTELAGPSRVVTPVPKGTLPPYPSPSASPQATPVPKASVTPYCGS